MPRTGSTAARRRAKRRQRDGTRELQRAIDRKRLLTERHLRMSIADWRLKKRQEWRAVMNALELFNYGSAYTPTGNDLYELQKSADRIKEAMDADWVCW